jgi:UDP-N-acetyl-2-amino-2-deoxyglucuronate dehydrogenase
LSKITFAIVGLGHIGKRYADLIQNRHDAEIVALVETNTDLHQALNQSYSCPVFSNLHDLDNLQDSIDVVCIATPNYLHCEQASLLLNKGFHVVIEKPMGLTSQECQLVIDRAKSNNRNVFCVMQNRYSPPSSWLKSVIDANLLGAIYHVQINCFWNRDNRYYQNTSWKGKKQFDGGTLFTQFSHFVDTLFWIFGDIENVQSRVYNYNHKESIEFEDTGLICFDLVKGGSGTISYSTSVWNKNLESSITVIGEKGSVKVGGQYMDKVLHCDIENYVMPVLPETNAANDYGNYKGSAANHQYVIQNVIDVLNGVEDIKTSAEEGMKVVEIIERIYNS